MKFQTKLMVISRWFRCCAKLSIDFLKVSTRRNPHTLAEPEEPKETQILHDALLLTECILYPTQVQMLKEQIISKTAQKLLARYCE